VERVITGTFDEDHFPCLEVEVQNRHKGLAQRVKAIIDTGAAHCMIREALATRLELEVLRTADYRHPVFGTFLLNEYSMDLQLEGSGAPGGAVLEGVRAGTLNDPYYPASLIIGVEVLQYCRFTYDGTKRTFTLTLCRE